MPADPTIDALREVLEESLDEIRRGIADLSVEQLNATPAGGETNSIAVIVTHALGATQSWLSLAMGAPLPPRDRPAEFRAVADDGFAAWTEDRIARCLSVLDGAHVGSGTHRDAELEPATRGANRAPPPTRPRTRSRTSASMSGICT